MIEVWKTRDKSTAIRLNKNEIFILKGAKEIRADVNYINIQITEGNLVGPFTLETGNLTVPGVPEYDLMEMKRPCE